MINLSDIKKQLLKSKDILGRDSRYLSTAVLVPLIEKDGNLHLVLEKRSPHIPQGGEICFPGGKFDITTDTSAEMCAIRECSEEIGIEKKAIQVLGNLPVLIAPMGLIVEPVVAFCNVKTHDFAPNEDEVEEILIIPLTFFIENTPEEYAVQLSVSHTVYDKEGEKQELLPVEKLGLPSRYKKPWGGRRYPVFLYRYESEIIWGLTADILREFVELLL